MTPQDLRIIGLKYDAAGMVVLGGPAVLSEVSAQSGTYWGHNLPLARALSTARVQSRANTGPTAARPGDGFRR